MCNAFLGWGVWESVGAGSCRQRDLWALSRPDGNFKPSTCCVMLCYVCMQVLIYVCTYLCMFVCMHACMYVRMYECTNVCMSVHTCVCMYACMCVCLCMCNKYREPEYVLALLGRIPGSSYSIPQNSVPHAYKTLAIVELRKSAVRVHCPKLEHWHVLEQVSAPEARSKYRCLKARVQTSVQHETHNKDLCAGPSLMSCAAAPALHPAERAVPVGKSGVWGLRVQELRYVCFSRLKVSGLWLRV